MKDDVSKLTQLGSNKTSYSYDNPDKEILETFPNKYLDNNYIIEFISSEFTSLCPKTGQPDFAKIIVQYIANEKCIESKSFKLYLFAYRNYGSFMETIINKILEDLVEASTPKWMKVQGEFKARGGIKINVTAIFTEK